MNIIRAERVSDPLGFCERRSHHRALPETSSVRDYGIDTCLQAVPRIYTITTAMSGGSSWRDTRLSDQRTAMRGLSGRYDLHTMGVYHGVEALSDVKLIWLEGPLQGQRRQGHLGS